MCTAQGGSPVAMHSLKSRVGMSMAFSMSPSVGKVCETGANGSMALSASGLRVKNSIVMRSDHCACNSKSMEAEFRSQHFNTCQRAEGPLYHLHGHCNLTRCHTIWSDSSACSRPTLPSVMDACSCMTTWNFEIFRDGLRQVRGQNEVAEQLPKFHLTWVKQWDQ